MAEECLVQLRERGKEVHVSIAARRVQRVSQQAKTYTDTFNRVDSATLGTSESDPRGCLKPAPLRSVGPCVRALNRLPQMVLGIDPDLACALVLQGRNAPFGDVCRRHIAYQCLS